MGHFRTTIFILNNLRLITVTLAPQRTLNIHSLPFYHKAELDRLELRLPKHVPFNIKNNIQNTKSIKILKQVSVVNISKHFSIKSL